jgi:large subunit ribosomal protein L24
VVVEGARKMIKATKSSEKHPDGGLLEVDGPVHISNVKKLG